MAATAKETGTGKRRPPDSKLSWRERYRALGNLPAFFRLIWATNPSLVMLGAVQRLVRAVLPVAMLYVGKLIVDEVVRLSAAGTTTDLTYLWQLIGLELGLVLLSDILGRGIAVADSLLGDRFSNQTSLRLMEHAAKLELARFEDSTFYDKLERARQQTAGRVGLMSQTLSQVQDTISMALLAAGLVVYYPWLILLVVVALVPAFLGEVHFNARSYSLMFSRTPERRELDYLRYIGASDETAKEVKIFGLSTFLRDRFAFLSDKFYTENRRLTLRRASWGTLLAALGTLGYYAAYVLILLRTVRGEQTLGDLLFLTGSFTRLKGLLEGVLGRFSTMAEGALYLRDLFEFFKLEPTLAAPASPRPIPQPIQQGFVFENVSYRYGESKRWAIRNLSFTLHPGERLALVGENGSGKTTLVKLLARLYDPTEGRILLDGYDLKDYDPAALQHEIGIIFQDFIRYQLVASDNIAVGRIDARTDAPRIAQAAERSLAASVIDKLPDGYQQMIGKRFAAGVELSGGEWQKIAIARAYMREAQLLILDEPTAALDARAEYEVFSRFAELTQGKMAVLISHRFSTVRMADRILVLENGELREQGSHTDLLAQGGRYAELFRLQALGYQ